MDRILAVMRALAIATLPCVLAPGLAMAQANIDGVSGTTTFNLTAKDGYITSADGGSLYTWGYALGGGVMQYPGPTIIVNEGDTVTVNLTNSLAVPVSIVFPGQNGVTATGGSAGLVTQESTGPADTVTYSFVASRPGTFMYQSGTQMDLQVEMGLVGALIVRPAGFNAATNRTAYGHADSAYEHEYLFLLTEMDNAIHEQVQAGNYNVDTSAFRPTYWFINGRTGPDTLFAAGSGLLPHQPYNIVPRAHPGDRVLMRVISAGRQQHPFHHHGNNSLEIARDGRLLASAPGAGADLSFSDYTIPAVPGGTYDAIFQWTGEGMGWDIYGTGPGYEHGTCITGTDDQVNNRTGALTPDGFHDTTWEYCPDHGKPFPVTLPGLQDLTFGGFYSGSPYLGISGSLPPGEGGLNPTGALYFMWHSHNEKELINFDVFPGGMMTMFAVEANGVPIP